MRRLVTLATLAASAVGLAVSPAFASTSLCSPNPSAPVFAPWLDPSLYTVVKGATFESGASGWSWGGQANIIAGDDGRLASAPGSHVVQLPGGGTAKSPWMCVDLTMPTLRFLIRRVSGTGNLTVTGQIKGANGIPLTTFMTMGGSGSWQPSPIILFPAVFTSVVTAGGLNAQFQFTADPGTTYRIDDVYIDPYKRF